MWIVHESNYYSEEGVQQRGHDLYDLYYELPEEQQQEVLDSYLLWTIPIGTEITEDIVGVKCDSFFDMLSVNARLLKLFGINMNIVQ